MPVQYREVSVSKADKTTLPALLAAAAMMQRVGRTVEVIAPAEVRAVEQRGGLEVRRESDGSIALVLLAGGEHV